MATPTPKTVSPQQYRQLGIAALTLVSSSYALYRFVYPLPTLRSSSKRLFHPATAISEDNVSLDHLLAAFGADGRNAKGTAPGCMVASPSKEGDGDSNNYWFQWPRDTGLCVRSLVEALKQAETGRNLGYSGEEIERRIRDFVLMSIKLQHLPNPSGTFETGGLGEPKFEVDGSAFKGSWGRPQNDGPALRSITTCQYMSHLLNTRSSSESSVIFAKEHLWSPKSASSKKLLIRDDLDYLCRAWKDKTFELWEEVAADAGAGGGHFHVLMTQRRALLEGAKLARMEQVKDEEAASKWEKSAKDIEAHLERFWNPKGELELEGGPQEGEPINWSDERKLNSISKEVLHAPHIIPTLKRTGGQPKPVGADNACLLAFTHAWDGDLGVKEDDTWQPWSERCLATLNRNVEIFASVYPINKGRKAIDGIVCGRYPEDVYNGVSQSIGNPWFLTTFVVSNVLYLTVAHYGKTSLPLPITTNTFSLFKKVYPPLEESSLGTSIHRGTPEYEGILKGLRLMADHTLTFAATFANVDGRMSEQIDRYTGKMRGARELSWSFASALAVKQAREACGPM